MALNEYDVHKKMKLLMMVHVVYYPLMCIHDLNSMNFDWVPQRDDFEYSYYIIVGIIILIITTMITWFKIRNGFNRLDLFIQTLNPDQFDNHLSLIKIDLRLM
jgi:Mg2+ and Co2+ transporter CorA